MRDTTSTKFPKRRPDEKSAGNEDKRDVNFLTEERHAEKADLNIRTLQKIEAGELNVLITTAARIQRALACPWDKLMP